jgi:tRNA pseudouridine38-40 synthase|tara:strand:- start:612 stop:1199 length:588 start_codon:yes stop_codon:yes gene_type:complete
VISFDSKVDRDLRQYIEGINYYLPESIAVKEVNVMLDHFDPRKHALSRTYRYNIINSEKRYPLLNRSHFRVVNKLNISKINESINLFVGEHDFKQFSGPLPKGINTYREILDICVSKQQNVVQFIVKGKSFLRRQVRRMVGTLVDIGLDKVSYDQLKSFLDCSNKPVVYTTLPPQGLCLVNVEYPDIFYKNGEKI